MSATELLLIDLSSIAHPIWHVSQSEPDANATSTKVVERVRALAANHPHAAICCDAGRSFRRDLEPTYKANRPASEAPLQHQIDLAREQLAADGFPVWAVKGFEADDLIATATRRALETEDLSVLVVSADKDMLQLVGPRVRVMNARDGQIFDAAAVVVKFGVTPEQMRDYLMLVGDASDNVKGAIKVGPKTAAELLGEYGTLDSAYKHLAQNGSQFKPSIATSLHEFRNRMAQVRILITLRTDVDLPFEELANERVPAEAQSFESFGHEEETSNEEGEAATAPQQASIDAVTGGSAAPRLSHPDAALSVPNGGDSGRHLAVREPDAIIAAPAEWERQLDPRSMREARMLAGDMYQSRMFSAYGTPAGVLSTVMVGRELGLPAMAALRGIHVIEGKHSLSASLMVALVLKSGMAEFFEVVSFSETEATYETKRKGALNAVRLTHTIEMATKAGLVKDKSGWQKNPTDMLCARASARLARMIYPDLLAGLYTPEELTEIRESVAA
ncbi:MAG: 5'-3' exonuclease H3TH domain-containing protein [Vicinamibacterales bacterium]